MKKISKRILLLILAAIMLFCSMSITAFAADLKSDNQESSCALLEKSIGTIGDARPQSIRDSIGIYSDIETLIYVGKGSDCWLHIAPWLAPNRFTIRMVDYQGRTVWRQTFTTTGITHWFVGSNVKYVYLTGIPGGVVDVTDTEH